MRIRRLDLTRFGNFTNTSIDLSAPGVHVIVGENEAGKTTAMTAIRQLLYGIPSRSAHGFLHDKQNLRLGALLEDESQMPLEIVRVKKQNATLRDSDDTPIDESVLKSLLHHIDQSVYSSLFTVGHEEVALGGQALLSSDGEVGRALFSVGHGAADLNAVLREIDERAAALFKNSASIPKLNAAIRAYKEHSESARKSSTSSSGALQMEHDLDAAVRAHAESDALRREKATRLVLLERVRFARPLLATRDAHVARMQTLEDTGPLVAPELGDRLNDALAKRAQSHAQHTTALAARDRIAARLDEVSFDAALLAQLEEIQAVTSEHGGYLQYVKDLPALHVRVGELDRDLDELLGGLPESVKDSIDGGSVVRTDQEARVQELIEQGVGLKAENDAWVTRLDGTADANAEAAARLVEIPEPVDMQTLGMMAESMRIGSGLETTHSAAAHQLENAKRGLDNSITALGFDQVSIGDVDALVTPSIESIRATRIELERLNSADERLSEEIKSVVQSETQVVSDLQSLLERKNPRSLKDLADARSRRQSGWTLIVNDWIEGDVDEAAVSSWTAGAALKDAYQLAVECADEVGDELREAAEAVTERANFERDLQQFAARREALMHEHAQVVADAAKVQVDWTADWAALGITAGPPEEMEQWHERFREAVKDAIAVRTLSGEVAGSESTIERYRSDLDAEIRVVSVNAPTGLSLAALLRYAADIVEAEKLRAQERTSIIGRLAELESKRREQQNGSNRAADAVTAAQIAWGQAMKEIGLLPDATPAVANAVLRSLASIAAKRRDKTVLDMRVAGVERGKKQFVDRLNRLLAKLDRHDDLFAEDPGVAARALGGRLNTAISTSSEVRTMTAEHVVAERLVSEATIDLDFANTEIDTMLKTTNLPDVEALRSAIVTSSEHQEFARRISEIETSLRDSSGRAIERNEAEALEFDGFEIEIEIADSSRDIEALEKTLAVQAELIGNVRNRISQLLPLQTAADSLTAAQESLALVADYGDEFVVLGMAKALLQEQVFTYREQNQGPILNRARALFKQLTLGRYSGIDVEVDDKGNAHLQAVSATDSYLDVSALSSGTRDQLYLALRLGALEQMIESRGSLPIVLDDLLVHFDDPRTAAGLEVLNGVSDYAQVLLFTHHERVADEAKRVMPADRVTVHRL